MSYFTFAHCLYTNMFEIKMQINPQTIQGKYILFPFNLKGHHPSADLWGEKKTL